MRRLSENIKVAFQCLFLNKTRSFLTILGIVIGVAAVIAMLSIGMGARESIMVSIQGLGSDLIYILPGSLEDQNSLVSKAKLTINDLRAIKRDADLVSEVTPLINSTTTASYLNNSIISSVNAVSEGGAELFNIDLEKGIFFNKSDVLNTSNVVVIGETVKDSLFGKMEPIGKMIKIDGKNFKVIGLVRSKGTGSFGTDQDNNIYIPITTAQEKLYGIDSYSMILVKSSDKNNNFSASEEIRSILRKNRRIGSVEEDDFMIQDQSQIIDVFNIITGVFTVVVAGIASISLLVGGIGIMNIMLVSVTERTREIGVRKAIGAKNRDILVQFLVESVILSLSGGIVGILFAMLVSYFISSFTVLEVQVSLLSVLVAVSFSTAIGLFFGIFPAMRAARLNPIDALRYE